MSSAGLAEIDPKLFGVNDWAELDSDNFGTEFADIPEAGPITDPRVIRLATNVASLAIRENGAYIVEGRLWSPSHEQTIDVLYPNEDITPQKLSHASHAMLPAGPHKGRGGQHGFVRKTNSNTIHLPDTEDGEKQAAFLSMDPESGLSIVRHVLLSDSSFTISNIVTNRSNSNKKTSKGEHLYFDLAGGDIENLRINDEETGRFMSIDERFGVGSLDELKRQETLHYTLGNREKTFETDLLFPAGHTVRLSAEFFGDSKYPLSAWLWQRKDGETGCVEPVAGVNGSKPGHDNRGVSIGPGQTAILAARVEQL